MTAAAGVSLAAGGPGGLPMQAATVTVSSWAMMSLTQARKDSDSVSLT